MKDSKSSYAIEGETPPQNRIQRWGRILGEAGGHQITIDELIRLQEIVIGDTRFVRTGLRRFGGFAGEHDRDSGMPIPEHISARAEEVKSLLTGLVGFNDRIIDQLNPVVAATCIVF